MEGVCAKCKKPGEPKEFVKLNWRTRGGNRRSGMVHTDCFDKEIKIRVFSRKN